MRPSIMAFLTRRTLGCLPTQAFERRLPWFLGRSVTMFLLGFRFLRVLYPPLAFTNLSGR